MAIHDISLDELSSLLKHCASTALLASGQLRFDFSFPQHRIAIALLRTTIDHATAVSALIDGRLYAAIPVVARAALEAYVDLVNVCDYPRYWRDLELADAREWQKLCERASAGRNPYLFKLTSSPLLPPGRRLHADVVREGAAHGAARQSAEDRFVKAGLRAEYESAYSLLSAEAHNNVSYAVCAYFDATAEPPRVRTHRTASDLSPHYEKSCPLMLSEIVLNGCEKVLRKLGHGIAVLSEPRTELERVCSVLAAQERP